MTIVYILASLGITYIAVDIFGEGATSAHIAGFGIFILTLYLMNKEKN